MSENAQVARASVWIAADRGSVWDALVAPATITKIMPVREVVAAWRPDSVFVWTLEMQGGTQRMEGKVLRFDPGSVLEYDFIDPHARAYRGTEDLLRVTIELADEAGGTRVDVAHHGYTTRVAWAHAEGGWRLALNNLKAVAERTRGRP